MNGDTQAVPVPERPSKVERIVVESNIPVLDTGMFDHMCRLAKLMAASSLVPVHLNAIKREGGDDIPMSNEEAVSNCFLVTNQAIRWRMDPFAVAQHVYVTKGRVGYEGKLIAAVINSHPAIEKRLTYAYSGEGESRRVTVSATLKGDDSPRTVEGTVAAWKTTGTNSPWGNQNQREQMLAYRGAREWARRWLPEAVLGVWGDDELEFENQGRMGTGQVIEQAQPERSGAAALKTAALASGGGGVAAGGGAGGGAGGVAAAAVAEGPKADAKDEQRAPAGDEPTVEQATAHLAECKDGETMRLYEESLPAAIRANEDFTKAFHKRLGELAEASTGSKQDGKKAGTPRLRKQFVERFGRADQETLDVAFDETRFYIWSTEDSAELVAAYNARKAALAK